MKGKKDDLLSSSKSNNPGIHSSSISHIILRRFQGQKKWNPENQNPIFTRAYKLVFKNFNFQQGQGQNRC
jgi:hypothetical protein